MHTYRKAVPLGMTTISRVAIDQKLARLEDEWMGDTYDMLDHNCCHFCNHLAHELGVGELPSWVNRAAGVGASIAKGVESVMSVKDKFRRSEAVASGGSSGSAAAEEQAAAEWAGGGGFGRPANYTDDPRHALAAQHARSQAEGDF
jgi:hypothetical protein